MSQPQTLAEWAHYISGLSGQPLWSQTVAFNTHDFARQLVKEGATMGAVQEIALLFVRQLKATGTKVPADGAWDMLNIAQTDPIARRGPTMSEKTADAMADSFEPTTDDLDTFLLEASFAD
jgi:hypothetical protein